MERLPAASPYVLIANHGSYLDGILLVGSVSKTLAPGPIFSARNRFQNFVRISCGLPWTGQAESAMKILGQVASELVDRRRQRGAA